MSTNKTTNYNLNQWVKSDQVRMEDFNADNAKIDAALGSKASTSALNSLQNTLNSKISDLQDTASGQETALSQRNCRFVTGSYTGTGKYGPSNANTLTFTHKPVFVCVTSEEYPLVLNLIAGQPAAYISKDGNSRLAVTWGSKSVSWYVHNPSVSGAAPVHQMNAADTYYYFAILEL